ncbi:hypothetical protein F5Y04DRAFT_247348 [Hypomontagnella monticulosa]|nr:hypothetical protein F5Y04DRAFT_247348 [Hypomontagnella monticulosa]
MLHRPHPLPAHDSYLTSSIYPGHFQSQHYRPCEPYTHNLVVTRLHLAHNHQINSFNSIENTWNNTRKKLVARWKHIWDARFQHQHRIKRSMVKRSTAFRNSVIKPQDLELTSAGDLQSRAAGPVAISCDQAQAEDTFVNRGRETCQAEPSVHTEELRTSKAGSKFGDSTLEQPKSAGLMEGEKKAGAAKRPSHCRLNHEGDRGLLTPDQYVAIKRKEAVALVMARFQQWFDKRLAIISYAYEASEASGGSTSSSGGTGPGSNDSRQSQSGRSTRTKRRLGGDGQDNSSAGGDEGDPDRGVSKRAKKEIETEKKFACPYYKHDPRAHCKHRSCTGPGWASLHRLKEHLYRAHRLPKHTCPRCNEPFDDAKDLADHLRADVPCEKLDVIPLLQGIDETTEAKLKVRKKNCPGMTDEQRWRDIYMILFPEANPNAVPSPYYDAGDDSLRFSKTAEEWRKVKKRIQKELPKFVQKKVERSFEKVEVDVLVRLPDIVRDGLFEFFKDLPHSPEASPSVTPRARTPSFHVVGEQAATAVAATSDEDAGDILDLSRFLEFPNDVEYNDLAQFDFGDPVDCLFMDRESDSGYASTSTGRGRTAEIEF